MYLLIRCLLRHKNDCLIIVQIGQTTFQNRRITKLQAHRFQRRIRSKGCHLQSFNSTSDMNRFQTFISDKCAAVNFFRTDTKLFESCIGETLYSDTVSLILIPHRFQASALAKQIIIHMTHTVHKNYRFQSGTLSEHTFVRSFQRSITDHCFQILTVGKCTVLNRPECFRKDQAPHRNPVAFLLIRHHLGMKIIPCALKCMIRNIFHRYSAN